MSDIKDMAEVKDKLQKLLDEQFRAPRIISIETIIQKFRREHDRH